MIDKQTKEYAKFWMIAASLWAKKCDYEPLSSSPDIAPMEKVEYVDFDPFNLDEI